MASRGPGDFVYTNVRCRCGAVHLVFTSKKVYPGQDRDELPFWCKRCNAHSMTIDVYDSGESYIYLKEDLPPDRVAWLPRTSSGPEVTQADYPGVLSPPSPFEAWRIPAIVIGVLFLVVVLLLLR